MSRLGSLRHGRVSSEGAACGQNSMEDDRHDRRDVVGMGSMEIFACELCGGRIDSREWMVTAVSGLPRISSDGGNG